MSSKYSLGIRKTDRGIFESLKKGEKSIETRAGTGKFQRVKKGDLLVFNCDNETLTKEVKKIKHFESIEDIFKQVDTEKIFPGIETLEELKKAYFNFPNYKQKIKNNGLVAFWLS